MVQGARASRGKKCQVSLFSEIAFDSLDPSAATWYLVSMEGDSITEARKRLQACLDRAAYTGRLDRAELQAARNNLATQLRFHRKLQVAKKQFKLRLASLGGLD